MTDKEQLMLADSMEDPGSEAQRKSNPIKSKLPWYFASGFLLFWGLLFFAVVIPRFYKLPTPLTMEDAKRNVFIAERAYNNLHTLSNIGTKLTGSRENEVEAVNFILKDLAEIKEAMLDDYFDMEIDVSQVSGAFPYKTMLNMYQGVQNIAVKLSPKGSNSETYLLVNSHFDSKPFTPSAGDAGFMVVTMLEVLRVIATTRQTFEHPIVFLFNGAEEGAMQASHGFITQHKWAPNCKAVVNLDAGGSGGREILFQSGPNHAWIVNYYKNYVKYPFATTLAEEIFQTGIVPSDTDFRQFNIYGNIPGLDMGQCINGFRYHTIYDTIDAIPRGSLQNTGDNVLSVVRGLANAPELHDLRAHRNGHSVFFDFLGFYFIHYSEITAIYLNLGVAGAALILIFISMWRMTSVSNIFLFHVTCWFTLVLVVQIISFVLGLVLPAVVAYVFDYLGLSLTYYSTPLLIVGLYVCPSLIGLSLPVTIYHMLQQNDKISNAYHLQLSLHAQAIILALLTIGATLFGLRSIYISVIPLIFYVLSLAFNLLTTLHDRGYAWTGVLKLSQVIPFLYSSYLFYTLVVILTPMGARAGSASNRDLYVAIVAALGTVLSFGFLVPLINSFRRPSLVIASLLAVTAVAMYLASSTQLGFPYRPRTNGQRVAYLQVRNKFYEYDGTLSKDESGYLFNFQDRLREKPFMDTNANLTGLVSIKPFCEEHMMCGLPLFDYRYVQNRLESKWLARSAPIEPKSSTELELVSKTQVNATIVRFVFKLTGPSHMSLFIQPYEDAKIVNWSFSLNYLKYPPGYPLAFHIYFRYGIDSSPLTFYIEILKSDGDFNVPLFQLGVSGHYIGDKGDAESEEFAAAFPSYSILATWPVLYQRFIY
ncbi:PREDICTED: endoplasmic reticulum metallopeptidase 1-like [Drosophila arizonae]|uniref:Endoplasmic reticulum metallopeptidase 1-like n=1 Tax=Drosophila arizonae TaxID=7263 RepID=A0ABM1PE38_DROAR|nr:PREDICTED: endoplasmic reticulum metallopeptidase 1-like [Drosophila arizonae]